MEEPTRFIFRKASATDHIVEHVAIGDKFHYNGEVRASGEDFTELHDVGMQKVLMIHDFTMGVLNVLVLTANGG